MSIEITGAINFSGSTTLIGDLPETSWTVVSGGLATGGVISRPVGALYRWGQGVQGQIGDGNVVNRSSPVQISGIWRDISSNGTHNIALKDDYTLWAWGANLDGQLGDNSTEFRSSPVQIGTSSWLRTAAYFAHNMAIRADGTLWGWGYNGDGGLGIGPIVDFNYSSPVQVGTDTNWSLLPKSKMSSQSAAIKNDGSLWLWGVNYYLPFPFPTDDGTFVYNPTRIDTSSWSMISGTADYAWVAIRADGGLFTWGIDGSWLGDYDPAITRERSSPVQIGTSSWISVGCVDESMFAIRSDGALFAWGQNNSGQLGLGDRIHRSSPVQVGTSSWIAINGGGISAYAIRADNTVWAWGGGANSRLGTNSTSVPRSSPVQVAVPTLSVWP